MVAIAPPMGWQTTPWQRLTTQHEFYVCMRTVLTLQCTCFSNVFFLVLWYPSGGSHTKWNNIVHLVTTNTSFFKACFRALTSAGKYKPSIFDIHDHLSNPCCLSFLEPLSNAVMLSELASMGCRDNYLWIDAHFELHHHPKKQVLFNVDGTI